jgi:hypothetical protein
MEPGNCWEYWDCPKEIRENCPAYTTDSGKDCFNLAKDFCPKLKNDFDHCWECPWYMKLKALKEEEEKETIT